MTPPARGSTAGDDPPSEQTARLPDGTVISERDPVPTAWKDIQIRLQVEGVSNRLAGQAYVESIVGNHAENVRQEPVTLPAGEATLALVRRTPPAASGSTAAVDEYWPYLTRPARDRQDMDQVYALTAVATGDADAARSEVLQVGGTWRLPPA